MQGTSGINLTKVTLTKAAPTISLTKNTGATGVMRVNLNWTKPAAGGGFLARAFRGSVGYADIDLDLGCLWETTDGRKGVIQPLGRRFGSLTEAPYIQLDGDDRSGQAAGGENLSIDLSRLGQLRRVLVFAHIYDGVPNWASADGVVTLYPQGAAPIEVRLDEAEAGKRICAIALLTNQDGNLHIQREVQYIQGAQSDLDRAYGWGMSWTAGRK